MTFPQWLRLALTSALAGVVIDRIAYLMEWPEPLTYVVLAICGFSLAYFDAQNTEED